jgi:hypothetical protein
LFGLADVVIVPSSGDVDLMRSLGIPDDKIALVEIDTFFGEGRST